MTGEKVRYNFVLVYMQLKYIAQRTVLNSTRNPEAYIMQVGTYIPILSLTCNCVL